MKRKNILTAIAGSCLVLGGLTSCEDFLTLYPTNQITEEEFWEDKGDVESGMMACYVRMTNKNLQQKVLHWGEGRSDNSVVQDQGNSSIVNLKAGILEDTEDMFSWAPFYTAIKERLLRGEIGDIINIQATEHVSYHHLAVSFVRGKWGNEQICGAPMLLAKCCHDMDLIMWLKSGIAPTQVASFGCDFQFDPAKKPAGAGKRCLVDCKIEEQCLYSAKKHYIDHPDRWAFYVWDCLEHLDHPTIEDKIQSLKTDNIHGRCVWDCNHSVVDHQSVLLNFADGATATLNMIGGTAKPERNIHIIGTKGEIKGVFDDSVFVVRTIDTPSESGYREEVVDLKIGGDKSGMTGSHGGGDLRLVEDFVRVLQGAEPSVSCTSIQDSVRGHRAVFRAEAARKTGTVQPME